jgi:hypothetical protein
MPGKFGLDYVHATLLQGVAALNCKAGVIGGAAGAARDTEFYGVFISKNAGPAVLAITGLADSAGAQQSMVINGSTAQDTFFEFPAPIVNELAPFTFQPSVAGAIWVLTRAYTGP